MAYEDAVQLPNGAWFDITAFRLRVLQLNATLPSVPEGGRIRLASGYTHDVELMVARLALADGGVAVSTPDSLNGIRLPNGNVYDAFDLNRRLVARDGGVTCFLPRIGATLTSRADEVKLKLTPGGFVAGNDGTATVPVVPPSLAPALNWRLGITGAVTDSAADATLQTAIQGSSSARTLPAIPLAVSASRTITIPVVTVAAPGGFLYVNVDHQDGQVYNADSGASVAPQVSSDGGGTFTTASLAQGGWLDQGRIYHLPPGTNAVRAAITNGASSAINAFLGVFQRPASGRIDTWLVEGASFEGFGAHPRRMRAAMQNAYPASDPIFFNMGVSGQTLSQISARAVADIPNFPHCSFSILNPGGNQLSPRPSIPVNGDFANMKADFTAMINAGKNAGMVVLTSNISYRDGPTGTAGTPFTYDNTIPINGSNPVNQGVMSPLISTLLPDLIDPVYGVARADQYGLFLKNRDAILTPGDQHPQDGYVILNDMEARVFGSYVYGAPWPDLVYEPAVAAYEANPTVATKNAARELVDSLPASAIKTSLTTRLNNGVAVPVPAHTTAPSITGTPQVGGTLTLSPGVASNTPLVFNYTLTRSDGVVVQSGTMARRGLGATVPYTPTGGDLNLTLTLSVVPVNGQGAGAAAPSAATAAVAAPQGQSNGGSSAANTFPFTGSADAVTGPNLYTDTPEASTWTRANLATPVTGQADCRNGFTAIKLSPANDAGNNLRRFSKNVTGLTPNDVQQISIEARGTGDALKGGRYLYINSGANGQVVFDLIAGTFSTPQSGVTCFMTDLGNGNWRCSLRAAINASSKLAYFQIQGGASLAAANVAADTTYAGDGASGVVVTKVYFAKV